MKKNIFFILLVILFIFIYQLKNKNHSFVKENGVIFFYEQDTDFKSYPEKKDDKNDIATVYDVIDGAKKIKQKL